jgi:hypothetical protein
MADTDLTRDRRRTRDDVDDLDFDDDERRPVRTARRDVYDDAKVVDDAHAVGVVAPTETRRAFGTTEFWITVIAVVGVIIAGYWDEATLRVNLAYSLAAGMVGLYVLSRGIAKAGSTKTRIREYR